jgi:hypothetical protein
MYPSQPEPGALPGAAFCSTLVEMIQKIAASTAKNAVAHESADPTNSLVVMRRSSASRLGRRIQKFRIAATTTTAKDSSAATLARMKVVRHWWSTFGSRSGFFTGLSLVSERPQHNSEMRICYGLVFLPQPHARLIAVREFDT